MPLPEKIQHKLQTLPDKPGVYFMRNRQGKIIYVGKAASLRDRVRNYFRRSTQRSADAKLRGLLHSVHDLDILVCRTEAEATLTEGRMIKDFRPRFNVLLKDDKRFLLLRIHLGEPWPRLDAVRLQKEDGATYFGPYASSAAAWAALEFIERRFGLRRCRPLEPGPTDHQHCLNDVVRYCSAPCIGKVTAEQYRARVDTACAFLRGERPEILDEIRLAMEKEAAAKRYEKAAALRDTLLLLRRAVKERALGTRSLALKAADAAAGVAELQQALGLALLPRVIEAYDVSHIAGTLAVGSMVCAVDGLPQKNRYRRFRIRTVAGSDDPAMMAEMIHRRYARLVADQGARPDLVLVDGGLTQLRAARRALDALGLAGLPVAGLAKRFEEIYYEGRPAPAAALLPPSANPARPGAPTPPAAEPILRLPDGSRALQVLQRLRDEAHRFALAYHHRLRFQRIRESQLDDVAGIGRKRKEVLLRHFGSLARLRRASETEIAAVPGVGQEVARLIKKTLAASAGDKVHKDSATE